VYTYVTVSIAVSKDTELSDIWTALYKEVERNGYLFFYQLNVVISSKFFLPFPAPLMFIIPYKKGTEYWEHNLIISRFVTSTRSI